MTLAVALGPASAQVSSDLLTRLFEQSHHVILLDIIDQPSSSEDEPDRLTYTVEGRIKGVFKGDLKVLSIVSVAIHRYEMFPKKDRLRLLRKGSSCVLFLRDVPKGKVPPLESSDLWFSVQPAAPTFISVMEQYRKRDQDEKGQGKARKP
jgi:hypothetical protein